VDRRDGYSTGWTTGYPRRKQIATETETKKLQKGNKNREVNTNDGYVEVRGRTREKNEVTAMGQERWE
jgi:hypothetical protein